MEETNPVEYRKRRKTLFGKRIIISAVELEEIEKDLAATDLLVADLRHELKRARFANDVWAKRNIMLIDRVNVMAGKIPAPLCPKCKKPKIAGGIQWIDHAECYAGKKAAKSKI